MGAAKRVGKILLLSLAAATVAAAVFALRGPYTSNALKRLVLPELEQMSGRKVIAQKMHVNLFPLSVEARDVKAFEENGDRILAAERVKAYVDLSGLLSRRLVIRRLVLRDPEIKADQGKIDDIVRHVRVYLAREKKTALKVTVKVVEVQKADFSFAAAEQGADIRLRGLDAELLAGDTQRVMATAQSVTVRKKGLPEIVADAAASLVIGDEGIQVRRFLARSLGSKLSGSGEYREGRGLFSADAEVLFDSLKRIFGLKRAGDGRVKGKGSVQFGKAGVTVDLAVEGSFYIQTLMELLKVEERVEGLVDASGSIKGPLKDLHATGTATLRNGNLFDVDVDRLSCKVVYERGTMSFQDGSARLYGGNAKVSASIALPVVNRFTVRVDFRDVDSIPLFRLIGWDPGVVPGKVDGTLETSGPDFEPAGTFQFRSASAGKDVLGRVRAMSGAYGMSGSVVTLKGLVIQTGLTTIRAEGTADIGKRSLDLRGDLETADISDLTSPYYLKLKGSGDFQGTVRGSFDDPVIAGRIRMHKPSFLHYGADSSEADVVYRKDLLTVNSMSAAGPVEVSRVSGSVRFRGAKELFDLSSPEYDLKAMIKQVDLDRFARIFYPSFRGTGRLHAEMHIRGRGDSPVVGGVGSVDAATFNDISVDKATFAWGYIDRTLRFTHLKMRKGKSEASGEFSINEDGVFSYTGSSVRMYLSDAVGKELKGEAVFSLKSSGHGTFDNPSIEVGGRIIEGRLKGKPVGSGSLKASIRDRDISLEALLLNNKVKVSGRGRLEKEIPWEAVVSIETARYDAVLGAFLKEIPEDLVLSLNGSITMHGDRNHLFASAVVRQAALSMYGYSFANDQEVHLDLHDRRLKLSRITLKGGGASVTVDGEMEIGRSYNLAVEGSTSLAPFKSLSARIGLLRGDAEFVLSVTGGWDDPQINGGMTLANGSFGLKDYPYRVAALTGYLYMDRDRVVLQRLTGKVGGGDVDISGIVYLKKFAYSRFYVEAELKNITASPSPDITVNFGGNLLYKGTPASQIISGDLAVNRARYRQRVEWKSWLLKARAAEKFKAEAGGLERAELNVRITGKENILVDNNVARATVSADLILRGTVSRPVLFGRVDTNEGTVFFRNNEFRILHASAGFFDPARINPIVQISAETVVRGYKIKMSLEGQMDHFAVSFSSDPMLKEPDILSLLAIGQTSGELKGLEGGIGASEATSFVTGKLQDVVEERMRNITGLDRFQIDSYLSKKTGTVEPRVTVSKRLIGDKFYVTYASSVGSTEEQIIKLEYFLGRNFSLVGVRDERGIVGGDIRFRFEFR